MPRPGLCPKQAALGPSRHQSSCPATLRGSETMGPVTYFSLCVLGCLVLSPALGASPLPGLGQEATACRHGWLRYRNHCYRFFPQTVTWSVAEVKCQNHHHGAHLASILSDAERDIIAEYLSSATTMARVWIGLHNPKRNTVWEWADGSHFRYTAWNVGEPNNRGGREYCAEVLAYTGYKRWNDIPCNWQTPYICKYRF